MTDSDRERLNSAIRDVPDFPKPGIVFKDITLLLKDAEALKKVTESLFEMVKDVFIILI